MKNNNPLAIELKQIEEKTAIELRNTFMPFFEQADEWAKKAKAIIVTSADQVKEMELARQARLNLKNIRVEVEKKRKQLKEESLRTGKAVDGMANIIKFLIVPVEEYLQQQEDFVKQQEEKRKAELAEKRVSELLKYEVETEYYNLTEMSENGYEQLLQTSKIIYEQRKEAERKAEEERITKEKAEAEERKWMQEENKRLKIEAEKHEHQMKIERKKQAKLDMERKIKEEKEHKAHELQLKKEREEKENIEAELKAKKEAEEKAKQETMAKEHEAKLAPDKKKLQVLAMAIAGIEVPEVTSKEAKDIIENIIYLLNNTSNYIRRKCADL